MNKPRILISFNASECFEIADALGRYITAVKDRKIRPNLPEAITRINETRKMFFKAAHAEDKAV
jgi:hypothetical protein